MKIDTVFLLKKQAWEKLSAFRRGRFDFASLLLRVLLTGALSAILVIFFLKFSKAYLEVRSEGVLRPEERRFELISLVDFAFFAYLAIFGALSLSRELFSREDRKLLSAMPIRREAIFVSSLLSVAAKNLFFALAVAFPLTIAVCGFSLGLFVRALCASVLLAIYASSAGALLALPLSAVYRFFRGRSALSLFAATLFAMIGFALYARILGGIRELLIGEDIRYLFGEDTVCAISRLARNLHPADGLSRLVLGGVGNTAIYLPLSLAAVFVSMAAARISPRPALPRAQKSQKKPSKKLPVLASLMKKELYEILRTPGYAFSCFSTAALLPLMVYFCLSAGGALLTQLIGIDCRAELALMLTLLLSTLANGFCSTSVSREGESFYCLKALPIPAATLFSGKLLFQLSVSFLSEGISAALLFLTGQIAARAAILVFAVGTLYSLSLICVATRYDLSFARFPADEETEASESGGSASAIILLGVPLSLALGGGALALKLFFALRPGRGISFGFLAPSAALALLLALAALFFYYRGLSEKLYEFGKGGTT